VRTEKCGGAEAKTGSWSTQSQSVCLSAQTSRWTPPQHQFEIRGEASMSSPLELGKEAVRHERAINSLRDRIGAPLVEVRRLYAQEVSRLELGAIVRSYLAVLVQRTRSVASKKRIVPGRVAVHNHTASIKLWNEHLRNLYRRPARTVSARVHDEATRFRDRFPRALLRNAARLLREQLSAEGVSVWLSAGCLAELARIASAAAARTRQADESYESCLRREILTHARFIREWTSSDKKFDQTQWSELVSIARKYALPRSWRLCESVASVRLPSATAPIRAQEVLTSVAGQQPQVRYFLRGAANTVGDRDRADHLAELVQP
jgi:hypothetical protein